MPCKKRKPPSSPLKPLPPWGTPEWEEEVELTALERKLGAPKKKQPKRKTRIVDLYTVAVYAIVDGEPLKYGQWRQLCQWHREAEQLVAELLERAQGRARRSR